MKAVDKITRHVIVWIAKSPAAIERDGERVTVERLLKSHEVWKPIDDIPADFPALVKRRMESKLQEDGFDDRGCWSNASASASYDEAAGVVFFRIQLDFSIEAPELQSVA